MKEQRFYDREKNVRATVNQTRLLPPEIQEIIAGGISSVAIRDYQADQRMGQLKSLGAEQMLSLHKSKHKRRDYDQVIEFHTAMNYIHILEDNEQKNIALTISGLIHFAHAYLEKCRFIALLPDRHKLAAIRDNYLSMETQQAKDYLQAVQDELSGLSKPNPTAAIIIDGSRIHLGEL